MTEIERANRKGRAKHVLSIFVNEAHKRGFKGAQKLYRTNDSVQLQIRLDKCTHLPENKYYVSLGVYVLRDKNKASFHDLADIIANEQGATAEVDRKIRQALDANAPLSDWERSAIAGDYLDNSVEQWFRLLDSESKILEFIKEYDASDPESRKLGRPWRPVFDHFRNLGMLPPLS